MEGEEGPNRELYALLSLSPEASDADIRKAYRQWAQVYHPDKYQDPQMQDVATENFQRIREAYDILSDEQKRQIYDIYGLEGLNSGLELGPKLKTREELRKEFERVKQQRQDQKSGNRVRHFGSMIVNLSLADLLDSFDTGPALTGMASSTQVQTSLSRKDTLVLGGSMAWRPGLGAGSLTCQLRRQTSNVSSIALAAVVGARPFLSLETSRQLSAHSTGTLGLTISLSDGYAHLGNRWSRQLSESTTGNIELVIGPDTAVTAGWVKQGVKNSGQGEVKLGATSFGVTGRYTHNFSSTSYGRVTCKVGSTALEVDIGGERKISEHSAFALFCTVGIRGVLWRIRLTRGGQKFIFPIILCSTFNPIMAAGAAVLPWSLYLVFKRYVIKPFYLRRKERKNREQYKLVAAQVIEGRAAAEKAQLLLKIVAERKKTRQEEKGGLVITKALYGKLAGNGNRQSSEEVSDQTSNSDANMLPPVFDVTIPLNFLVDDSGNLQLHGGVKKSGLMGFCDPCPLDNKQLQVSYVYDGHRYEVVVGDTEELIIPQEGHKCFDD